MIPGTRARHLHRGRALLARRGGLVGLLLADGAPVGESLEALGFLLREIAPRGLLRKRSARLRELDLEGLALDAKERRARLDRIALVVELALDDAGDARAYLHVARALGAAHRLEGNGHGLRRDLDHAHRHRRRRGAFCVGAFFILRSALAAAGDEHGGRDDEHPHHFP